MSAPLGRRLSAWCGNARNQPRPILVDGRVAKNGSQTGEELFVGSLNGGPDGSFTTTYKFEAKLNPDGSEIRGRCQHPIVADSGTGGFAGASGRVDFKDIIGSDSHIRLPRSHPPRITHAKGADGFQAS